MQEAAAGGCERNTYNYLQLLLLRLLFVAAGHCSDDGCSSAWLVTATAAAAAIRLLQLATASGATAAATAASAAAKVDTRLAPALYDRKHP